jgi:uncharacterized protein
MSRSHAFAKRFPKATFSLITNGSYFDRETLDVVAAHDMANTISHDGPGQHLRGPDPLDDPDKRRWIETMLAERPEKTGFNAVLMRQNHDLRTLKAWFAEKVGPDIVIRLEGVVNIYDAATVIGTGRFEPAELNSMTRSIFQALVGDPNASASASASISSTPRSSAAGPPRPLARNAGWIGRTPSPSTWAGMS